MVSQTKLLSIPISATKFRRLTSLAQESGLTVEDLTLQALNEYDVRHKQGQKLAQALAATREDGRRKGSNKLTMREINDEIAIVRRELQAKKARQAS